MTLYYNMVFSLLVVEMGLFVAIAAPLPVSIRRRYLTFFAENTFVHRCLHYLRIGFFFVGLLFLDSVNRVYRVQREFRQMADGSTGAAIVATDRSEIQARRFYSQRNMYLCGFTIFLSFVLHRYLDDSIQNIQLQDEVKLLRQSGSSTSTSTKGGDAEKLQARVRELEESLRNKEASIEALKRQTDNLSQEYMREMNKGETGSGGVYREKM